jgi:hypothetical protein
MPVPRSQIGRPTEIGGPSGSPVTCMIPPMPRAIRLKPPPSADERINASRFRASFNSASQLV